MLQGWNVAALAELESALLRHFDVQHFSDLGVEPSLLKCLVESRHLMDTITGKASGHLCCSTWISCNAGTWT